MYLQLPWEEGVVLHRNELHRLIGDLFDGFLNASRLQIQRPAHNTMADDFRIIVTFLFFEKEMELQERKWSNQRMMMQPLLWSILKAQRIVLYGEYQFSIAHSFVGFIILRWKNFFVSPRVP